MPAETSSRVPHDCNHCEYRSLRMFCNLSEEELNDFSSLGIQTMLPQGAVLFQEDDPSHNVIVVCKGQVKLSCTSREGKTLILKVAAAGDVLGLSAVFSGSHYEVTAQALGPVSVKHVRRDEFLAFLERHGQASLHAARSLAEEYKSAFFDARRLALAPSAAGRLASVLLEWARAASCGQKELRFIMALTHEELANLAGTSRETVTRVLGTFRKDKLIQMRGATITILAPEELSRLAI